MKKQAFTLAETLIVLVVIGILAAILLPVARNIAPDKNLMKFKKAHNTLGTIIRELVQNEEYYLNGDLGRRPNGNLIDGTHDGDEKYFCQTIADLLSTKRVECKDKYVANEMYIHIAILDEPTATWHFTIPQAQPEIDKACKETGPVVNGEIETNDGVIFYSSCPKQTYGISFLTHMTGLGKQDDPLVGCTNNQDQINYCKQRVYADSHVNSVGSSVFYKIYCFDIDGIGKGEDPFGYGIRVDGQIINGARAQEWLEREK